ncbi:MAG: AraC family transcriptional regulator [Nocardioides sp.]|uniref:AraC family transcriptional regulator n=1 Tax=Nocardioides sp. TaxID=35761 RepID=UPI003D6ADDC6
MSAVVEVDSADAWQSVVSSCFVPLACNDVEPGFTGRMEHTQLDDGIAVALATSSGHSSTRTARLARGAGGDDLHLSLQRSSTGTVSSGSRTVAVRPGSVSVYRVDAPYLVDYSAPHQQQLLVQVSRSSMRLPDGMLSEAADRIALPRVQEAPAARALYSYASALPDTEGPGLATVVRDLAAVMIHSAFTSAPVTPHTTAGLRHTVRQHLRDHAQDRGLTMDEVARRHGVSRRRLYQVFEESGSSPAAYLRSVRLAVATEMFSAERRPPGGISAIAYSCGFNDPLTFTRAFRRTYGVTPREWRAGDRAT